MADNYLFFESVEVSQTPHPAWVLGLPGGFNIVLSSRELYSPTRMREKVLIATGRFPNLPYGRDAYEVWLRQAIGTGKRLDLTSRQLRNRVRDGTYKRSS